MDALMAVGTVLNGGVVIGNDKNFGDDVLFLCMQRLQWKRSERVFRNIGKYVSRVLG